MGFEMREQLETQYGKNYQASWKQIRLPGNTKILMYNQTWENEQDHTASFQAQCNDGETIE